MKKSFRIVSWIFLLVCLLLSVSCSKEPVECTHPEDALTVTTVEATCTEAGYTVTTCASCGYTNRTELPALGHDYQEKYVAVVGSDKQVCTHCGDSYFLVDPGKTLRLTGYCTGDAVFDATADAGTGTVELLVDDVSAAKTACDADKSSELVVRELDEGQHSFKFVNSGTEAVIIREATMEGKLNRPGSVLLEMPVTGKEQYGTFRIYIQTSDPSGDYYICYNMVFDNNDTRNTYKADSGTNVYNFRIRAAQLVKVVKVTDTAVLSNSLYDVLQGGEISLAFKQTNPNPAFLTPAALEMLGSGTAACDFSGGFHGDERMESVELFADGEKVEMIGRTKAEVIACSVATFNQTATIYAWGTSTDTSYGVEELLHSQNYVFDSNGVRNHQTAIWLGDGFSVDRFYLQMFTMNRVSGSKLICESFDTYDENGKLLGSETIPATIEKQLRCLANTATRLVKYHSATSGVSAEAGFRIIDNTVKPNDIYVAPRVYGDNKLYCSFESAKNGRNPVKGETWEIEVHYTIDFVKPE